MAKRSDFAQKLLDDLRARKEKMAMASSEKHSARTSPDGDAYGNSRWSFRGSGEATASKSSNKNVSKPEVTKMWLSTRHHRSPSLEGAPAGETTRKEHNDDMSMALAIALSNMGKLQNIEPFSNNKVGNKLILCQGSLSSREIKGSELGPSLDQFSFLSPLQIGEMSKGVQNLSMILNAYSNELNYSRDSIDIGRELLKGAIDLEDSLRMLMSLQDASDYMIGSQGKKIKLLNSKEEDKSSSEVNDWKLKKPVFSFDRSPREKHMAFARQEKSKAPTMSSIESSNAYLQLNSHRRTQSCGPGARSDAHFLEHAHKFSTREEQGSLKDNGRSTPTNIEQPGPKRGPRTQKVRIPNVIARLMGLEELPLPTPKAKNTEVQNILKPNFIKEIGKKMTSVPEIINREPDITCSKLEKKNGILQEEGIAEAKEMNSLYIHNKGKKKVLTSPEGMNNASYNSLKPPLKFIKHVDATNIDQSKESKVVTREAVKAREKESLKQQIRSEQVQKTVDAKPNAECEAQSTSSSRHEFYDETVRNKEKEGRKNDVISKEQRNAQKNNKILQKKLIDQSRSPRTGSEIALELNSGGKVELETNIAKRRDAKSNRGKPSNDMKAKVIPITSVTVASRNLASINDKEQPKEHLQSNHYLKQQLTNRSNTYHEVCKISENEKLEDRKPLKTVAKTDTEKNLSLIPASSIMNPVENPSAWKTEVIKVTSESKDNSKTPEPTTKATTDEKNHNFTSFLFDLEKRWKERTSKAGAIISSRSMNSEDYSQPKIPVTDHSCSPPIDDCKKSTDSMAVESTVECQQGVVDDPLQSDRTTETATDAQQPLEAYFNEDQEQHSILIEDQMKGPGNEGELHNNSSIRCLNVAALQTQRQGKHTENEHALKQMLLNNQHFLNTAQAIFKVKVPVNILQASENVCQSERANIGLDCVYELMRRKGGREELIFGKRMSSATQMRCLDVLIRELTSDLESLKFPRTIEGDGYDLAEFIHSMVTGDIYNRNPDVNSMWDFGWTSTMFANVEKEDILRDVEKHLLNGLINDIARDLMNVSIIVV